MNLFEVGETCNVRERNEKCIEPFQSEDLNGLYNMGDLVVVCRIILKCIIKAVCGCGRRTWLRAGSG